MTTSPQDAKSAKKATKARLKIEKKAAKAATKKAPGAAGTASAIDRPAEGVPAGPSPAERSAAAAERQVRLQHWRVILAVAGVIVALVTLLLTIKPWATP